MTERATLPVLVALACMAALAGDQTPAPEFPWEKWGLKPSDNPACVPAPRGHRRVWYLDIGGVFIEPDRTITREKLRDLLHPSENGYRLWTEPPQSYRDTHESVVNPYLIRVAPEEAFAAQ